MCPHWGTSRSVRRCPAWAPRPRARWRAAWGASARPGCCPGCAGTPPASLSAWRGLEGYYRLCIYLHIFNFQMKYDKISIFVWSQGIKIKKPFKYFDISFLNIQFHSQLCKVEKLETCKHASTIEKLYIPCGMLNVGIFRTSCRNRSKSYLFYFCFPLFYFFVEMQIWE